jgi:site-specific recombinase XerD
MSQQKTPQVSQQKTTSFDDALSAFIISREASHLSKQTLRYYRDRLGPFVIWCKESGHTAVESITAAKIRAFLVALHNRNLSPYTVHASARAIRAFFRFCASDGIIEAAPKFQMPKLPKRILPAFEPVDVARLIDACENQRDRCIVLVLLDTGLRASEMVALNGSNIDLATGAVHVYQGKGEKDRTVYLGARTRRELSKFWREVQKPSPSSPAWTNNRAGRSGDRITDSGLRQLLGRIGNRAGVENCRPHTFRRTFALWSLRACMDIYRLAALIGHEDLGVLRQYLALVGKDIRKAHEQFGPVDHMLK